MTTSDERFNQAEMVIADPLSGLQPSMEFAPDRNGLGDQNPRGTNQSGMRAQNERLVLTLLRKHGPLAKSDIARLTGLSLQTVSVIMRALEQEGLLLKGTPQRGRIGQPSVPMALSPEGAAFFGLKLGRRSADLLVIDFLGKVLATERMTYRYPEPDQVIDFVIKGLPILMTALPKPMQARIGGIGVAMPFELWSWGRHMGAPQGKMDIWRDFDVLDALREATDLPVFLQNDATAACGAERTFGQGDQVQNFLYFYCGYFIGGGLVLNGRLFSGRTGNAAGVGPMPVPGPDGRMLRLIDVASLATLGKAMEAAGLDADSLWDHPDRWNCPPDLIDAWVARAAEGLASAILSTSALVEPEAVLIDGWIPESMRDALITETQAALHRHDLSGILPPQIRAGTIGPMARALGAAAVPLAQRYLVEG